MTSAPLIALRGVEKSFGAIRALGGVDLELLAGEVHALVGENGAGKSTLIKVVAGAHEPDAGTLEIRGERVSGLTPARARELGVAVLHQHSTLFDELSVAENLFLGRDGAVIDWKRRRTRAAEALAAIGAEVDPEARCGSLGPAQRKGVEIARALLSEAPILVLDEPTAVLPAREAERLLETVASLRARGVGVLYISHRLEEVERIADRITVLRDGRTVWSGEARALTHAELVRHMVGGTARLQPGPGLATLQRGPGGRRAPARGSEEEEMCRAGARQGPEPGGSPAVPGPGWSPALQGSPAVGGSGAGGGGVAGAGRVLSVRGLGCGRLGLTGIDLEVFEGEVLGLAGLVGAGRSELAACLFGLERIDAGTIELDGRPFRPRSPREAIERGVVLVPEDRAANGLVLAGTVRENAALPWLARLARGGLVAADRERSLAERVVSSTGVRAALEARAGSLSGGNQQKLALGKWLVEPPRVLILDEPTQGIDVAGRAEIHARIGELAASGVAILLVSSDMGECLALSDRVAVLRRGRLAGTLAGERLRAEDVLSLALGVEGARA